MTGETATGKVLEQHPAEPPEIRVLNVITGQIVEIARLEDAEPDDLAEVAELIIGEAIANLKATDGIIRGELLRRLDRRRKWTVRLDAGDGRQWELTAPSPTAGTAVYDVDTMRTGLRVLVAADTLDETAAAAALERTVSITARVPITTDLDALSARLSGLDAIAGVPVSDVTVSPVETVRAAGVAALVKGGGPPADLVATAKHVVAATRRVKIKLKKAS